MTLVPVTFDRVNDNGPYGKHPDDGRPVYKHWYSPISPEYGRTYLCQLEFKGFSMKNYFAMVVEPVKEPEPVPDVLLEIQEESQEPVIEKTVIQEQAAEPIDIDGCFAYVGNDTIGSSLLEDGPYRVMRSLDGRMLRIIRDDRGKIICSNNMISMAGIDMLAGGIPRELRFVNNEGCVEIMIGE